MSFHQLLKQYYIRFNPKIRFNSMRDHRTVMTSYSESLAQRRKRLFYKCRQTGVKELDILLTSFLDENIHSLQLEQIQKLETILQMESLDMLHMFLRNQFVLNNTQLIST
jgi:succinate dehydrogenase flavin-adding protein (antitoxin of CptAB toxin-antitoxin module)